MRAQPFLAVHEGAIMKPMDRKIVTKGKLSEQRDYGYVPGTPEERINLAWELTREACLLGGRYDPDKPMQRHIVRLIKRKP